MTQEFIDKPDPIAIIHHKLDKDSYLHLSERYQQTFNHALNKRYQLWQMIFYGALAVFIVLLISSFFLPEKLLDYTQIGIIISFTLFALIGAIKLSWYVNIKRIQRERIKLAEKTNFELPFVYQIFNDGIIIKEPYQEGHFSWSDFEEINYYNNMVVFVFNHNKNKQLAKMARLILPIHLFWGQEKIFNHLRKLINYKQFN